MNEAVEAIVLKLQPGDIALIRLPEEILNDSDATQHLIAGVRAALELTGHIDKVAVLLTTDAIQLEVLRFDD